MVLDRAEEVLRLDRPELHEDGAQTPARRDELGGLHVLAEGDLPLQQQVLAQALVGVAAARVGHPPHVEEDALGHVAPAEGEDAGLPAAEDGPEQLGDAGLLDAAAEDEALVLRLCSGLDHGALYLSPMSAFIQSMGTGNRIVEFFSAEISTRVWR